MNELDAHGSSALMYASYRGHTETVRLLLNYGADVNKQRTTDGYTALMFASRGHTETVHLLLSHDATVNTKTSMVPLHSWLQLFLVSPKLSIFSSTMEPM